MTDKIIKTYAKLSNKAKLSIITAILVMVLASSIVAFAAYPAITVSWTAAGGTVSPIWGVDGATPVVRCYVVDSVYYLNPASLVFKLDGQIRPTATFEPNPAGGPSMQGTIQYYAGTLADGIHQAEVYIADYYGNELTYNWSFSIMQNPRFTDFEPAKFVGVPGGAPVIHMIIKDNGTIDWPKLYFRINGILQTPEIDEQTGLVVYRGPFPKGQVDIYVKAYDLLGNTENVGYWFYNDAGNPQFFGNKIYYKSSPSTDFVNGLTITDGILMFRGDVSDYINVNITNFKATVDGVPLNVTLSPNGTNAYSNVALTKYQYSGVVKDGNHTLVLNVTDQCGVSNSTSRTFTVKAPPVISNVSPVQYGMQDLTQLISATVTDPNGTIVPESVVLTVDGVKVNHNYDPATNKVTYQTGQLSDESYHIVTLTAADDSGNTASRTWKFFTDSHAYPDMADSNVGNCNICHPSFSTLESHNLTFYGDNHTETMSHGCSVCHNYISEPIGCSQCHPDPDESNPSTGHGYKTWVSYNAINNDPNFPLRVKTNREMFDCVICHQPGSGVLDSAKLSLNNHDIPEIHKYTDEDATCNQCHAKSLTKEHARPGRADQNGNAITCGTCHQSSNPLVVMAIANNQKSCTACHTVADHSANHTWNEFGTQCQECHVNILTTEHLSNNKTNAGKNYSCNTCHQSTNPLVVSAIANHKRNCDACHQVANHEAVHQLNDFDAKCQSCHNYTLTTEHLNNVKTTAGKNFSCATCHQSDKKEVKNTIAGTVVSCAGCHKSGHNMAMEAVIPSDIPQYPGFKWSTPMAVSIFQGETTTPVGYETGQVVISNWISSATVEQVWNYYNEQVDTKMAAKGWTLKSGVLASGAVSFTAEYEKAGRLVTIRSYKSAASEGSGSLSSTKIEVWYK